MRRFIAKDKRLDYRENVLLSPKVKAGAQKSDSLIVGVFVIMHGGARLLGQAFRIDMLYWAERFGGIGFHTYTPIASVLAQLFRSMSPAALVISIHVAWWISLGWVMFIIPYLYAQQAHTFLHSAR